MPGNLNELKAEPKIDASSGEIHYLDITRAHKTSEELTPRLISKR